MKQHKIEKFSELLNSKGHLNEPGYAFKPFIKYNPKLIKACKWRIKEWDYFLIGNKEYALSVTLANNRYMGVAGIQFFNFKTKKKHDYTKFIFKPKFQMPNQAFEGQVSYNDDQIQLKFTYEKNRVHLQGKTNNLGQEADIEVDIWLDIKNDDHCHMVIPFKRKPKHFYFNEKYNNLLASGFFKVKDSISFVDGDFAVLDWGRGVWPWNVLWYWSSMSGKLNNGKTIGINLGYGFGDTKYASENMVFYEGKGYKLNNVKFIIPANYIDTWEIVDDNNHLNLTFKPLFDNYTKINYIVLGQNAHQVFGLFSGTVIINGETLKIENIFGFSEKVKNRW